jgi:hypothetical protein
MKYSFFAHHTGRDDFDEWRNINQIPPPSLLSIEQRYRHSPDSLGKPLHEEREAPDETGRYQTFEHGSIHWYPLFGAYMTTGAIRDAWRSFKWESGWLGYPLSEEYSICEAEVDALTSTVWGEFEDSTSSYSPRPEMLNKNYAQAQQFYGGLIYWIREKNQCVVLKRTGRYHRGCPLFEPWKRPGFLGSLLSKLPW